MTKEDKTLIRKWLWNMPIEELVDLHGMGRSDMIDDIMSNCEEDADNAADLLIDAEKWKRQKDDEIATQVIEEAIGATDV